MPARVGDMSDLLIWPAVSAGITAVMLLIGGVRLIERRHARIRRGNLRSRLFK
jgi:hypothetical protein